jgi:hypothetical protein
MVVLEGLVLLIVFLGLLLFMLEVEEEQPGVPGQEELQVLGAEDRVLLETQVADKLLELMV